MSSKVWYSQTVQAILQDVGSAEAGLSLDEASARLIANGPNSLVEAKRKSVFRLFLEQFRSLLIWILIVAGALSAFLGEVLDAVAIFSIVSLNAIIGFYQELKAEKSINALKKMSAPHAKVRRNGEVMQIPASDVVLGDILVLEAGDLVAADARLFQAASLNCIESALTGESESVSKNADILEQKDIALGDRKNMVFMGTSVTKGTGLAIVVTVAMQTELGSIATMIQKGDADESTPLEKNLQAFGKVLIWATLGIVAVLFGLGWLRGTKLLELTMSTVSLAVAAVPESLPAVVTIALAVGVMRMSRRKALIRKLSAVETLGSTSVICTDKTGTLTVGEMTMRKLYISGNLYDVTGEGYGPEGEIQFQGAAPEGVHLVALSEFALNLLGCNHSHLAHDGGVWTVIGDPTEGAMISAGLKAHGNLELLEKEHSKYHEIPFDSDRKRSSTIRWMAEGKLRALVNGAPDILLERCAHLYCIEGVRPLTREDRVIISQKNAEMAGEAFRVLGSAYRDIEQAPVNELTFENVERDLVFLGLSGMMDPPRKEAKDAIANCHAAGIRVVMITGDHPSTAKAIAQSLGVCREDCKTVTGFDIDQISDADFSREVTKIGVYARVTAGHKLRIIDALRANGDIVAMTGDGVNDAPAIQGADIGIAMGKSGTEVTKEAADMIIMDDNFTTIVSAVEEGRGIYDNIRKTLQYLLAGNSGELLLMTVCVVIGLPMPLLPIHLLWINLVTDGLPALCLATDGIDSDVMKRKPRNKKERVTNSAFFRTMILTGFSTAGVAFAVYYYMLQRVDVSTARTYAFTVLVFAELIRAFGVRSESKPVWRIALSTNIKLVLVVVTSFAIQILSQHNDLMGRFLKTTGLPFQDCCILLAIATIPLVVLEIVKGVRRGMNKSH